MDAQCAYNSRLLCITRVLRGGCFWIQWPGNQLMLASNILFDAYIYLYAVCYLVVLSAGNHLSDLLVHLNTVSSLKWRINSEFIINDVVFEGLFKWISTRIKININRNRSVFHYYCIIIIFIKISFSIHWIDVQFSIAIHAFCLRSHVNQKKGNHLLYRSFVFCYSNSGFFFLSR